MKIYVVNGSCGEYSDRIQWLICAYESEHLAKAHVDGAAAFTREHGVDPYKEAERETLPSNPYDPKGYYDHWNAPRYWYVETDLRKIQ